LSAFLTVFSETKNTWSTFDIKGLDGLLRVNTNSLLVSNGSVFIFAVEDDYEEDSKKNLFWQL